MSDKQWIQAVQKMKDALRSDNNILSFFENFEPREDEGYCWTRNPQYMRFADILDDKTGRVHSGASFSICLRCALAELSEPIVATVVDESEEREEPDGVTILEGQVIV
tara:strand:- start:213 stop:536 length:324 start_codon:yes stop_codon:yes gene_type:complete